MSMEKVCEGLCRAQGTGQCAPLCLSHHSVRTTGGACPLRTQIWKLQGTEIAYALGRAEWIDPQVLVKETQIVVSLSMNERIIRAVLNPVSGEHVPALLVMQATAPEEMFKISKAQYFMMRAKAQRLLGRG